MEDKILFHGSRGGIDGEIAPISRVRCDFGKGFYMGEDSYQAKALVADDTSPYFYTLKFHLSEISEDRILNLTNNEDWLFTILANRKKVPEFNELYIAQEYLKMCEKYDVIIGAIADDQMSEAMQRFSNRGLTDKGLIACLKAIKYGNQYVAKTEFACSKIEILDCKELYGREINDIKEYSYQKKKNVYSIVDEMSEKYQLDGMYLNQIIKNASQYCKKDINSPIINNKKVNREYERQ